MAVLKVGVSMASLQMHDYILVILLLLSLYFDLARKKIPNFLTFPLIAYGLLYHAFAGGLEGFRFSLYGLLLGAGLLFLPFVLGGMGGGDVKLLGAVGAVKGAQFVFQAALVAAFCGGVLAVAYLLANRRLFRSLKKIVGMAASPMFSFLYINFGHPFFKKMALYFSPKSKEQSEEAIYLPYGVAIVLGTLFLLSFPGYLFSTQVF